MSAIESPRSTRVVVILTVAIIMACSWLPGIERLANGQIDAGLERALISFATARTLNAAISVVQGTEIAIQPLGVGVTLAPGQVLDPVNDLIEQFSSLMLAASIAFGVQKVLLSIGSHWLVSLVVTVFTLIWAALFFLRRCPEWLSRALVVLLMVRFAIPIATIGSDMAFQHFMAKDYDTSQRSIDATAVQVETLKPKELPMPENQSMIDKLKGLAAAQVAEWKARLTELKQSAERAIKSMIKIMVVFLLQTLVIPLVFIWILYRLAGGVSRPSIASRTFGPTHGS